VLAGPVDRGEIDALLGRGVARRRTRAHGVGSGGVGAEVFGFVFHGAFVEIGPCAEDGDAEARGVVEEWEDVCAAVG
jgi:hypothetical protein